MTAPARHYLDHNASAPIRPEAIGAMMAAMALPGNPSSVHAEGRKAHAALNIAREQVAALCGARPGQIVFTSGGTEANMLALRPGWLEGDPASAMLFTSSIEHVSVLAGGSFAPNRRAQLPVSRSGVLDLDAARDTLSAHVAGDGGPFMVSLMSANNETGALQPVRELAEIVHGLGGVLHCDAVQSPGRVMFDARATGADLISLSAHKLGGPKGVGALLIMRDALLDHASVVERGVQERGLRAGTENLAGIAAFGAAAQAAARDLAGIPIVARLRDRLEAGLRQISPDATIICASTPRLPNTTCVAMAGMSAEMLVIALDLEGVAVSAGSACSSGKVSRSHVLNAMRLDDQIAQGAIRVSLGWNSEAGDVEAFLSAWRMICDRGRKSYAAA
jgi:cysteine desulfurase